MLLMLQRKANTGDEVLLKVKVKFRLYMLFSSRWYQYNDYPSYDLSAFDCEQTLELFKYSANGGSKVNQFVIHPSLK